MGKESSHLFEICAGFFKNTLFILYYFIQVFDLLIILLLLLNNTIKHLTFLTKIHYISIYPSYFTDVQETAQKKKEKYSNPFGVTDQRLIKFSISGRYWRKKWEYNGTEQQLFIDFKRAYDSFRREELYNILIKFEIHRKVVGLIQMCLI
jgi:hypothetical protein